MRFISKHPRGQVRRLAPFVLLSLLLHVAIIFVLRLPTNILSTPVSHALTVFFIDSPIVEHAIIPDNTPPAKRSTPTKLLTASKIPEAQYADQPNIAHSPDKSLDANPQQMLESAFSIARSEARIAEQQQVAQAQKNRTTPAATLNQFLRQPHREIHLANGMLKIITDAGAVCFQPVPYFASDMQGLFSIPITCP